MLTASLQSCTINGEWVEIFSARAIASVNSLSDGTTLLTSPKWGSK